MKNFFFFQESINFAVRNKCSDGGIGRRTGLKILWEQSREGSSPSPSTKQPLVINLILQGVV